MTEKLIARLLTLVLLSTTHLIFSQDNKRGLDTVELTSNWTATYKSDFSIDSSSYFQFIKADSVFIRSWVCDELKKDYTGIDYCYLKAEKYAMTELEESVNSLCEKLKQPDANRLLASQKEWQKHYSIEKKFITQTFAYDKNLMMYRRYMLTKDRILFIKCYCDDLKNKRQADSRKPMCPATNSSSGASGQTSKTFSKSRSLRGQRFSFCKRLRNMYL